MANLRKPGQRETAPVPGNTGDHDPPPPAEDLAPAVAGPRDPEDIEKGAGHAAATPSPGRGTQPRGCRTTRADRLEQWEILDGGRLAIGAASQGWHLAAVRRR